MESDSWSRLLSASKLIYLRHQQPSTPPPQAQFDYLLGFEDEGDFVDEGDYEESDASKNSAEFSCPFCWDDFDMVSLCCHIDDEHPVEVKKGICPVCADMGGTDLIGHMTIQHGELFRLQSRGKNRRFSSGSYLPSQLRMNLHGRHLRSRFDEHYVVSTSSAAPDPMLSLFVSSTHKNDSSRDIHFESSDERAGECTPTKDMEILCPEHCSPGEQQEERARRSEFSQGLLLSTIFYDL